MTKFAHPSSLETRYAAIAESSVYTYDDDLVNYADFLRKHGRYMTKDGYVDSSRRVRSLQRQQDESSVPLRNNVPATTNKAASTSKKPKQAAENELPSVISISTNIEHKGKEHDKQMRLIEEQVIRSREHERDSKRSEGDVRREQRYLHHTLKGLSTADTIKKRLEAENYLSTNFDDKSQNEREALKKKEQQMKQRTEPVVDLLQTSKDADRRNVLVCTDLARQYRTKAEELEAKHEQLSQIHQEFQDKLHEKMSKENQAKKELAQIAMALHLESQKGKIDKNELADLSSRERIQTINHDLNQEQTFEQRLNKTSIYVKSFDLERRRLSVDVTLNRSLIDLKQREAARRIIDAKNRLETIYAKQRELNQDAAIALQDRRAAELMAKITDVDSRRTQLMTQYLREKTEREEEREAEGASKAKIHHAEQETRHHEDHLRHFQKTAGKNEETEHDLRESLKQAEYDRRKKEHEVQKLQDEIIQKKKSDAVRVRKEIARAQHEEKELEEQLVKEKAKLDKLHAKREDSYLRLIKHRDQIRENQLLLQTHEREYERLLRVRAHSRSLQSLNNI
ncbi:unnamed protein product [Adineta ricciae]|uniref:Uncharacterized protein n=1 Tax=Adineta ricciae TaxID=249248 RepID=A0A814FM23_ADIRI|nr:unnamed protein product [Adineta ricciae]